MSKTTTFLLILISIACGYGMYLQIPVLWDATITWNILTGEDVDEERVKRYHEQINEVVYAPPLDQMGQEHGCVLNQTRWSCSVSVTSQSARVLLEDRVQEASLQKTGWVEPMVIRQEIQRFMDTIEATETTLSQLETQIKDLEQKIKPQEKNIARWRDQLSLLNQNYALRSRQLAIFDQLLPMMDPTSDVYKAYQEERGEAKTRINEITQDIKEINQTIQKLAPAWLTLTDILQQKESLIAQVENARVRRDEFETALDYIDRQRAPHPRQYAFQPVSISYKPILNASMVFPGSLCAFLVLSNLFLWIRWGVRRMRKKNPTEEETVLETSVE